MNAKILAEIYLSRTREHEKMVEKAMRKYTKASNGHTVKITSLFLYTGEQNQDKVLTYLFWPHGPGYLQVAFFPARTLVFIIHGTGEELTFEKLGQGGGGALGNCIGLLHVIDHGVLIAVWDDVARGQLLEIDDVVRGDDNESLPDAET